MIPGIDPKVDYVFKWLFGKDVHESLLLGLLNAVLRPPPDRTIVALRILNPFNDKQALDDKLSILDIHASDQHGRRYNIEMQMRGSSALKARLLYYWAVMYADQLREGVSYTELRTTITICFVNSVLFPDVPDYHLRFGLRSDQHPHLIFCDQQEIHVVELPKFKKSETELSGPIDSWCYFLIHGETMDTEKISESLSPGCAAALEELAKFAQDDVERQRYRDRIKALRDQRTHELEEREEGREEGRIRLCQTLLEQPLTPEAELASMSRADLQAMAEALQKQLMEVMRARKPEEKRPS